jgi:hypothetical protein
MNQEVIEIHGQVQSDGTLLLDERLQLPAGRVLVTVQPIVVPEATNLARFRATMEKIWAGQKARGHVSRTKEEIDLEIQQLRQEAEEELRAAEELHEECQHVQGSNG